jgi:hypothetical protein
VDIRKRNFTGSARESELPIWYRLHLKDNITLGEGRGNTFIMLLKEKRKGDCGNAINSKCSWISGGSYTGRPSESERLWKKMIGEPYSRKATVRFDEGELEIEPSRLLRQLSTLLKETKSRCEVRGETQHAKKGGSGATVLPATETVQIN